MELKELQKDIHENAKAKGFWDKPNIAEKLMLIVSELGEALEADRNNKTFDKGMGLKAISEISNISADNEFKVTFEERVKDTFEDELADAVIRILDLAEFLRINIFAHIEAKHRYNKMREHLHGKKY